MPKAPQMADSANAMNDRDRKRDRNRAPLNPLKLRLNMTKGQHAEREAVTQKDNDDGAPKKPLHLKRDLVRDENVAPQGGANECDRPIKRICLTLNTPEGDNDGDSPPKWALDAAIRNLPEAIAVKGDDPNHDTSMAIKILRLKLTHPKRALDPIGGNVPEPTISGDADMKNDSSTATKTSRLRLTHTRKALDPSGRDVPESTVAGSPDVKNDTSTATKTPRLKLTHPKDTIDEGTHHLAKPTLSTVAGGDALGGNVRNAIKTPRIKLIQPKEALNHDTHMPKPNIAGGAFLGDNSNTGITTPLLKIAQPKPIPEQVKKPKHEPTKRSAWTVPKNHPGLTDLLPSVPSARQVTDWLFEGRAKFLQEQAGTKRQTRAQLFEASRAAQGPVRPVAAVLEFKGLDKEELAELADLADYQRRKYPWSMDEKTLRKIRVAAFGGDNIEGTKPEAAKSEKKKQDVGLEPGTDVSDPKRKSVKAEADGDQSVKEPGKVTEKPLEKSGGKKNDVKKSDTKKSDTKKSDIKKSDIKNSDIKNSDIKRSDIKKNNVQKNDIKKSDSNRGDIKKSNHNKTKATCQPAKSQHDSPLSGQEREQARTARDNRARLRGSVV